MNISLKVLSVIVLSIFCSLWAFSQAPPAPSNLTVEPGLMGGAILRWDTIGVEDFFGIYKSVDGLPFSGIGSIRHPGFLDWQVYPGHSYRYFVKAFNINGESLPSDTVHFEVGPPPPPPVHGVVMGTITDDSTGLPIKDVLVSFFRMDGYLSYRPARTDSNGNYRAALDTGRYIIRADRFGYAGKWYDNVYRPENATVIRLLENDTVYADFGLQRLPLPVPVSVSGTVRDSATGQPIRGAFVAFLRPHHALRVLERTLGLFGGFLFERFDIPELGQLPGVVWAGRTDSLGNYIAHVLSGQRYIAVAFKPGYIPEFYNDKRSPFDADRLLLTSDTSGINFDLVPIPNSATSGFSGNVSDSAGSGIPSHVLLLRLTPFGPVPVRFRMTDSLGGYAFYDLLPGRYFVRAVPIDGYAPAWYKNGECGVSNWHNADTLHVDGIADISITICVVPTTTIGFARIAGQIVGSSSMVEGVSGLQGVSVYAVSNITNNIVGYDITEDDGSYSIDNLIPGTFSIVTDKEGYIAGSTPSYNVGAGNNYEVNNAIISLTPESPLAVDDRKNTRPSEFLLEQNYPNPFNPTTEIKYTIPEASVITLKIFNVLGQEIATLPAGLRDAGTYTVTWEGRDDRGNAVGSGVYFFKMVATSRDGKELLFNQVRKSLLLK
jgi:hypothetical protein